MAVAGSWRRGQSYPQEVRDRVLGLPELSSRQVAERFGVSVGYVVKARTRLRGTGERAARARCGHVAPKLAGYEAALRERVTAVPDATLCELRAWLLAEHAVVVSTTALWMELARLGLVPRRGGSAASSSHLRGGGVA